MDIGFRIKYIRNLKGLTQKELGLMLDFPENAADVRVAQYESGTRIPRDKIIIKLAETLEVNSKALSMPDIKSFDDIIQMLFAFEDAYICEELFGKKEMTNFLTEWQEKREQLSSGKISKKDYDLWRFNYSGQDN